jgi:hypothetical protein
MLATRKRPWEFDPTYPAICLMEPAGLAQNVKHKGNSTG